LVFVNIVTLSNDCIKICSFTFNSKLTAVYFFGVVVYVERLFDSIVSFMASSHLRRHRCELELPTQLSSTQRLSQASK